MKLRLGGLQSNDQLWSQDRGRERRGDGTAVEVGTGGEARRGRADDEIKLRYVTLSGCSGSAHGHSPTRRHNVFAIGCEHGSGSVCLRNAWALIRVRQQGKSGERDLKVVLVLNQVEVTVMCWHK